MLTLTAANPVQQNLLGRASRYVVSGMDVNDLARIVPQVETWEDWRVLVGEAAAGRRALGLEARAAGRRVTAFAVA
jgi:hypothetical protein